MIFKVMFTVVWIATFIVVGAFFEKIGFLVSVQDGAL